jgi:NADH:ubiquinone oxidoreductase subunit 6 (subunit J)
VSLVLFYAVAALTLGAALGVVGTRNVVYGALFLLAALSGVAGLFVLMYAEFLALVQVLIYGGAIIIVILFALMLTRSAEFDVATEHSRWPVAALVSGGLFAMLVAAAIGDSSLYNSETRRGVDIETLGVGLFEKWAVPFEVASVVLLVALIGAIVIGRTEASEDDEGAGR